ncbi:hypothetical protein F4861DRAFT_502110 [Xylaria intraflava]|nr:hypothetical protein F4861DRAFT_502110 [Xylaria intraflava]
MSCRRLADAPPREPGYDPAYGRGRQSRFCFRSFFFFSFSCLPNLSLGSCIYIRNYVMPFFVNSLRGMKPSPHWADYEFDPFTVTRSRRRGRYTHADYKRSQHRAGFLIISSTRLFELRYLPKLWDSRVRRDTGITAYPRATGSRNERAAYYDY